MFLVTGQQRHQNTHPRFLSDALPLRPPPFVRSTRTAAPEDAILSFVQDVAFFAELPSAQRRKLCEASERRAGRWRSWSG